MVLRTVHVGTERQDAPEKRNASTRRLPCLPDQGCPEDRVIQSPEALLGDG